MIDAVLTGVLPADAERLRASRRSSRASVSPVPVVV
jgi:hypothetical protein